MAPRSQSLPITGPFPTVQSPKLRLVQNNDNEDTEIKVDDDGILTIRHPDGSVTIDFSPEKNKRKTSRKGFDENLSDEIDDSDLSSIATELLDAVQRDEDSRSEWLATRAMGIDLLGLKLEKPKSDGISGSAPIEGMSTVRHPILLQATTAFQATARAELLPAGGPCKVRNDSPPPPSEEIAKTSAVNELRDSIKSKDELAQALEVDFNHYLTDIATEYVPDTDRMLFYIGFGGDGFKKVYNCPLRRRVVSESVDAKDLIVSNAATDLQSCGRVTHRIMMRKSILRRMQIIGTYRDCELSDPIPQSENVVDQKLQELSGIKPSSLRPEDRDYEVLEIYCELDLDEFAPKKFKGKGLPLPYRVTIERDSRQILDIRRNWREKDDMCLPKQYFVQFPFIRGLGFYGLGYIHLLGNTANTLTAAWRLLLDNGMFANFPGFLVAKGINRQNNLQMRVAPGHGVGVDVGATGRLQDSVQPLPYKEAGPSFTAFIAHVEEVGNKLASSGSIQVGEGKQEAPVGTTLALIEQATKVIDSAHKRLYAAQSEEFKLIKERFREDPEAFWRHNKKPAVEWKKEQFIQALNDCELVPVADPNNPTSLHRIAKAMAIKELQKANPNLYDPIAVDMRIFRIVGIDPQGLFRSTPAPNPPDPRLIAIQQKAEQQQNASKIALLQAQIKAATAYAQMEDKEKDRQSRERIAQWEREVEMLELRQAELIHANDIEHDKTLLEIQKQKSADERLQTLQRGFTEAQIRAIEAEHDRLIKHQEHEGNRRIADDQHEADLRRKEREHNQKLEHDSKAHEQNLENQRALNDAKVAAAKALAKAKPKPKPSANSKKKG